MKPLYIFDLDSTLALTAHREHFTQSRRHADWEAYDAAIPKDKPCIPVIDTLELLLQAGADVLFFTGRIESTREATIEWLASYTALHYDDIDPLLHMRDDDDDDPAPVYKKKLLDALPAKDLRRLVGVFEGKPEVVKMWRREGIMCFEVNGEHPSWDAL